MPLFGKIFGIIPLFVNYIGGAPVSILNDPKIELLKVLDYDKAEL